MSSVMSPPEGICLVLSLRVRSGLMVFQLAALVVALHDVLRRGVDDVGVVLRHQHRLGPLEAIFQVVGAVAGGVERVRRDIDHALGVVVVMRDDRRCRNRRRRCRDCLGRERCIRSRRRHLIPVLAADDAVVARLAMATVLLSCCAP